MRSRSNRTCGQRWVKPAIMRVKLDMEQAVLAECVRDGGYFSVGHCAPTGNQANCANSGRAAPGQARSTGATVADVPS